MKKILVIHYSQSGQLNQVAKTFTQPLIEAPDIEVTFENVQPQQKFPFPWPFLRFFDVFPECVYQDPPPIHPSELTGDESFDLIILAYQVWFLSPSLPITGFLQSDIAKKLFKNKPVVTLIACRNMWLMAQETMKTILEDLHARLVGNVVLVDEAGGIMSFFATPAWVLSGHKGPFLKGMIPRAGVAEKDILACDRFGHRIKQSLLDDKPIDTDLLKGLQAVDVDERFINSEKAGKRAFRFWGALIRAVGKPGSIRRKPILLLYSMLLVVLIVTIVPLNIGLQKILCILRPAGIADQKKYFEQPSGSD